MHRASNLVTPEGASGRGVLVVDDDRDFADGSSEVLELNGYMVRVAHDAEEALGAAGEFEPDMAILDIRLGSTDGLDLLANLLERHPRLLCVMATGYAETATAIKAIKNGAYDFQQKPVATEQLLAALVRCNDTLELRDARDVAEAAARGERALLFDAIESVAEGFALF